MNNSPYLRKPASVTTVMIKVLVALLPGVAAYVYFFGGGILVQIAIASAAAIAAEAAMLALRGKPIAMFLTDGSALVTAWLIALTLPPIVPWWLMVTATALAVVVIKHLYGGLGQNPFNPAMVAFCAMIVAFPALMSQWPPTGLPFGVQVDLILGGERALDAVTGATPLDALRTALHSAHGPETTVSSILGATGKVFGFAGGHGWEWIALGYLAGGLWLIQQRVISWHIPAAFMVGLAASAGILHFATPDEFASPLFHLASGGAMLGAFFIATDPVSGATTPRGKLIFGAAIGFLTFVIRSWGAYPDGVAFAVLLLNICVPLIDMKTQPPVFGRKKKAKA
ncbi:MAG: RnfABCDGE type electron transport complex subunit D [Rhodocyclaceae bacterium]